MAGGAYGTVTNAGKANVRQSKSNQRRGPSNKNLASGATRRPNPAPDIRRMASMSIKGPDKGAGTS